VKTTITRIYEFSAAHILHEHPDKCRRLHGHNYKVEITIDENIWFEELDTRVNKILTYFDHSYLNDILETPTVEEIAKWIFTHGHFLKVKVWENDRSFAEVTNE
jgi:6-pyruvoyltetrahydropterin/6-carboxytetrahydropterin synthase